MNVIDSYGGLKKGGHLNDPSIDFCRLFFVSLTQSVLKRMYFWIQLNIILMYELLLARKPQLVMENNA